MYDAVAAESGNKVSHGTIPVRQATPGHLDALCKSLRVNSVIDNAMSDDIRWDIWNSKFWQTTHTFLSLDPYPTRSDVTVRINPFDCATALRMPMQWGTAGICERNILLVPTVATLAHIAMMHSAPSTARRGQNRLASSSDDFRRMLNETCSDGSPSWVPACCGRELSHGFQSTAIRNPLVRLLQGDDRHNMVSIAYKIFGHA